VVAYQVIKMNIITEEVAIVISEITREVVVQRMIKDQVVAMNGLVLII
jgi:hypothetical protein